jgi:uncharacterized protein (TIGR03382 family)
VRTHTGTLTVALDGDPEPQLIVQVTGTAIPAKHTGCSTGDPAPALLVWALVLIRLRLRRRRAV